MSPRSAAEAKAGEGKAPRHLPLAGFLLLPAITLLWGINWPVMKLALTAVPVWDFRLLCLAVGGLGILALALFAGQAVSVPRAQVGPLLLCSLFNVVGWHVASGYGVTLMPSGRASIIAFTMPLWASLLSIPLLGERPGPRRLLGLALGLLSLAVLIGPDLAHLGRAPLGALLMLTAALSWATGTVLMKRFSWTVPTASLAGWQLLAGVPAMALGSLLVENDGHWAVHWSWQQVAALLYAVTIPMVFCFWAWLRVVALFPAPLAALGTLAIPVVGVFSGALLLGEPAGPRELLSLGLVVAALAAVLVRPSVSPRPSSASTAYTSRQDRSLRQQWRRARRAPPRPE